MKSILKLSILLLVATQSCSQEKTQIRLAFENDCIKNDHCDSIIFEASNNIRLDISAYIDADLIHLESKEAAWYYKFENTGEIELSAKTLIPIGTSEPFHSFEKSTEYLMDLGIMKDDSPKSIFVLHGANIKIK